MKIAELLNPKAIAGELRASGKGEALGELTDVLVSASDNLDAEEVLRVLHEREALGSTGIGEGVAIPHGKLARLDRLLLAFGRSRQGVDFDSMDGRQAHLFFLLVAPEESVGVHLKTLARISKLLKNPSVRRRLIEAPSEQLYDIIVEEEDRM
ncbi:PTS sugar transporter subunit IIA [Trichloromonas sp.]|uniref:PTS sugar transporter subunit IIA n=1 Tax=Trichloromonas sp. TaxID=3069249 RepID=UPI002A3E2B75|nr:PTS sugar transporter subunit IIA [Trichloromonas sp.]